MKSLGIAIAASALAFALGGSAEAKGAGHLGHGVHVARAHFAGHRFDGLRSNRGGLRRGLARAAYVHRLNAARTRHAAHEERHERAVHEERHEHRGDEDSRHGDEDRGDRD
jgi:hypothetical protein